MLVKQFIRTKMGNTLTIPLATNSLAGLFSPTEKRKINNVITVDASGNGDYMTLEDALINAGDTAINHVVIRVMPGTYYPAPKEGTIIYQENSRNLSIIGVNKDATFLVNDNGYYWYRTNWDNAILRLSGNVLIKNLTFRATSNNFLNYCTLNGLNPVDTIYGTENHRISYCIHADMNRSAGDVIHIENCSLINDHFATVGFGLRANSVLRIKDCYVDHADDLEYSRTGYGAVYGHLAANLTGLGQNVELINNTIYSRTSGIAFNLLDSKSVSATPSDTGGTVLLQRNICKTIDTQNGYTIASTLAGYVNLSEMSFGNNILDMNF